MKTKSLFHGFLKSSGFYQCRMLDANLSLTDFLKTKLTLSMLSLWWIHQLPRLKQGISQVPTCGAWRVGVDQIIHLSPKESSIS